jgi:hypothetical protein
VSIASKQQHALVVEPDAAVGRREVQARSQVCDVGKARAIDRRPLGRDEREHAGVVAAAHH